MSGHGRRGCRYVVSRASSSPAHTHLLPSSCLSAPPLTSQPLAPRPLIRVSSHLLICSPRPPAVPALSLIMVNTTPIHPATPTYLPSPASLRAALWSRCPSNLRRPRPTGSPELKSLAAIESAFPAQARKSKKTRALLAEGVALGSVPGVVASHQ